LIAPFVAPFGPSGYNAPQLHTSTPDIIAIAAPGFPCAVLVLLFVPESIIPNDDK
jgi:hypothetical protein